MNITETELRAQYNRAIVNWHWIRETEDKFSLPPFMLYALGSRETNLQNVIGDGGHGRGIWQRDDRSFKIPIDYLSTPLLQSTDAASLLVSHFVYFRDSYKYSRPWYAAVCAYNAGRGGVRSALESGNTPDSATTGEDYGSDVLQRWSFLCRWGTGQL